MLRKTYNMLVARAQQPGAVWWMCAVSFAESSFFPLPPDILLVPMCLKAREKMWLYASLCALASLIGGFFGYAVGFYLFESVGRPVIEFYNAWESFLHFQELFALYGPWFLILKGVTPIPYKLLAIAAGFAKLDIWVFALCSVIARFSRYYLVTALLWFYGPEVEKFIERRLMLVTGILLLFVVGGILSFKLF